ncbi:MAG: glycosyltransferase family protein [Magnetococcales bacterium]|nr:glycosyltransferase family protein [Magnetococcales bacterium]
MTTLRYPGWSTATSIPSGNDGLELAFQHHASGHWDEARTLYTTRLNQPPHQALARIHLALLEQQAGNNQEAIAHLLAGLPRVREIDCDTLLRVAAKQPSIFCNFMGIACHQLGRMPEALACYQKALSLQPDYPAALSNYGFALMALERWAEAREQFSAALALQPDFPEAHANLGAVLQEMGRYREAEHCFRTAIGLNNEFTNAWYNLGLALQAQGRHAEARPPLERAIQLEPQFAEGHLALGLLLLRLGDHPTGWAEHEWRWRTAGFHHHGKKQPLWNGTRLPGQTILLHGEQGFGDSIQFIRYAPLVKAMGATVLVQCPGALVPLFQTAPGIDKVFATEQTVPPCTAQAPLMSLPHLLRTTVDTIPASLPYLAVDPERSAFFSQRAQSLTGFKIGVAWRGNPKHKNDRHRSMSPHHWAPLGHLSGLTLIGLQKPLLDEDREIFSQFNNFVDWSPWLDDFSATAAAIAQTDLVIAVDSAVIHLAGALNHPAWILLPMVPDWRWGLDERTTPWYPGMRQFRQTHDDSWDQVMARIRENLFSGNYLAKTNRERLVPQSVPVARKKNEPL